jgi:hypothetical protein
MDVRVRVSGVNADRLELTYVLFNDVWARRYQTNGMLAGWKNMGFKRVDLKDGYEYHVFWDFD